MKLSLQKGDSIQFTEDGRILNPDMGEMRYTIAEVIDMVGDIAYTLEGVSNMFTAYEIERVLRPDEFVAFQAHIDNYKKSVSVWVEMAHFTLTPAGRAAARGFAASLEQRIREYQKFLDTAISKERQRASTKNGVAT